MSSPAASCSSGASSPAWPDITPAETASDTAILTIDDLNLDMVKLCLSNASISSVPDFAWSRSRRRRLKNTQKHSKKSRKLTQTIEPMEGVEPSVPTTTFSFGEPEFAQKWFKLSTLCRFPSSSDPPKPKPRGLKKTIEITMMPAQVKSEASLKRYVFAPFQFLNLPSELRDLIYKWAIRPDDSIRLCLSIAKITQNAKVSRLPYSTFALLSTSQQIRAEALPILYQIHRFYTHLLKLLPTLATKLGPDALRNVRTLELGFWGLNRGHQLFRLLENVHLFHRLQELKIHFDYFTIRQIREYINLFTQLPPNDLPGPFCEHQYLTLKSSVADYIKLFEPTARKDRITMHLLFEDKLVNRQIPFRRLPHEWPVSDCICCAILNGFKRVRNAAVEAKSTATAADADRLIPTFIRESDVTVVRRVRVEVAEKEEVGAYWPVLAPEPRTIKY